MRTPYRLSRRTLLSALGAATLARPASADDAGKASSRSEVELDEIAITTEGKLARRATLVVPKLPKPKPLRLLVLLHGLGETVDEKLGIRAWVDRYGLNSAYQRLASPPIERTIERNYLSDPFLSSLNESLRAEPFQGLAMLCPFTPNVYKHSPSSAALDDYTDWLDSKLIPEARNRASLIASPTATGLDGCSLGGYVALEVFSRKPALFGVIGGVQAAIGAASAARYASSLAHTIARAGPRPIHLSTSTGDPYRKANELLAERLAALGVPVRLEVHPGPHDQPWLREVGTLGMLRFFDRQLLPYG